MALRRPVPRGECMQCWRHAYDPDVHRRQRGDCQQCIACAANGHAGKIQK